MLILLALLGCTDNEPDETGPDVAALCAGEGDVSVVLGTGAGSEFTPIEDGDVAGLDVAPQGGFGVSVRARTTGLQADAAVAVLLDTEIDGQNVGSFLNEEVQLYCQEDGTGLLWGVVVGFDPSTYSSNDDLLALDGEIVDLVVTVTDGRGESGVGRNTVEIAVGGR